ncbi:DnaT-like ssDNA-binding domain-containing protein [Escherichia coli]|uniref:DnaT-like ssDNA-binding domain-containing protein n=1 Tax=Escherichia coli TaxID=562 RepID=UPI0021572BD8|nr:DnaT-like ssDNA-binding domain-containing protein [Escherichia coli]
MSNAWLRLWHDMPNDPKWRTIARVSGQPIATVMAVYIHLLVSASRNVTTCHGVSRRGHVDVTAEDLASALDVTEEVIDSILQAMQGRVLDGDLITGWEKRQVSKEDNGNISQTAKTPAERKRAQREREKQREQNGDCCGEISRDVTSCHDESRICHDESRHVTTDKDKDLKELNPTHNARVRESAPTSNSTGAPSQTTDPEYLDGLSEPIGKFPMTDGWHPSLDFRRRAAVWGVSLPEPEFTPAELAAFRDYWMAEGKVFTQVQWEQKFARHVNHVRAQAKPVSKGVNHAAAPGGTASRAVREIRAAREQWERENGFIRDGNGVEAVGTHGGGLFEPMDSEERGRTVETLDCTDWRDD